MITAKFWKDEKSIHMTLRGHAGAAPKGEDLICASATMMAYTIAQVVEFMHKQGKLVKKPKIRISQGRATIIATPTEDGYAECLHTFFVAQCGVQVLAHNYPQYVKLALLS